MNIHCQKLAGTLQIIVALGCAYLISAAPNPLKNTTFCNPINIDYNFYAAYREAADPTMIVFNNEYYLFASHSAGYWWSTNMLDWQLVKPTGLDVAKYAPTVMAIGSTLYFTTSESGSIYRTTDPKAGVWALVGQPHSWDDPALFKDSDGKVYCYHNCSANGTIDVVELDPNNNFAVIGTEVKCFQSNRASHGFEVAGDNNSNPSADSWLEGAWMTKDNGSYYLQFSVPGTELRTYCDGCYVATAAKGPFTFCPNSPICSKPLGFVTGTGHSSTFQDVFNKYWHVSSVAIAVAYKFERRLAIFPAAIDTDHLLHTDTYLGDYPQYIPGKALPGAKTNRAECQLLSYQKKSIASSTLTGFAPQNAFDENIKTWWSAATANSGEWLMVDLGKTCEVAAIQTNFAEQNITYAGGRGTVFSHKYKIEASGSETGPWTPIIDKTTNTKDVPHDYVPLDSTVVTRYVRITNAGLMPGGGKFAIRDLRIFGSGQCSAPAAVAAFTVARSASDPRKAILTWNKVADANGYIIRLGGSPEKLYNNYQIMDKDSTTADIRSLTIGVSYYYAIDTYSDCGITPGTIIKRDDNTTTTIAKSINRQSAIPGALYKVLGNTFIVPACFKGKTVVFSAYTLSGRLLCTGVARNGAFDIRGSASAYIVKISAQSNH